MNDTTKRCHPIKIAFTTSVLFALLCGLAAAAGAAKGRPGERELEDKMPAHVPIKVKVKNLGSEKWARELEVEVKNTGAKPIYHLNFFLLLPETESPDGRPVGFQFVYGRREMVDIGVRATPSDTPLNPGETHIFKIEETHVKGWEKHEAEHPDAKPKKFRLMLSAINFGDGTGFLGTDGAPIPSGRASNTSCVPERQAGWDRAHAPDSPRNILRGRRDTCR